MNHFNRAWGLQDDQSPFPWQQDLLGRFRAGIGNRMSLDIYRRAWGKPVSLPRGWWRDPMGHRYHAGWRTLLIDEAAPKSTSGFLA